MRKRVDTLKSIAEVMDLASYFLATSNNSKQYEPQVEVVNLSEFKVNTYVDQNEGYKPGQEKLLIELQRKDANSQPLKLSVNLPNKVKSPKVHVSILEFAARRITANNTAKEPIPTVILDLSPYEYLEAYTLYPNQTQHVRIHRNTWKTILEEQANPHQILLIFLPHIITIKPILLQRETVEKLANDDPNNPLKIKHSRSAEIQGASFVPFSRKVNLIAMHWKDYKLRIPLRESKDDNLYAYYDYNYPGAFVLIHDMRYPL